MSESTNIIRPDNRNLLICCVIATIIGIVLLCLILVVNDGGGKIVIGSIGGVMIFVGLLVGYFAIKIKLPDITKNPTELQTIAVKESHKGELAITQT